MTQTAPTQASKRGARPSKVLGGRGVWCTWETQRRNSELAEVFDCHYLRYDFSGRSRLRRYAKCLGLTTRELRLLRPEVVFAQCPSVVLTAFLAVLKPFFGYRLIIDAHNAAFLNETLLQKLLRLAVRLSFACADAVIVSNDQLCDEVRALGGNPLVLPDKLPTLAEQSLSPEWASTPHPRLVFVTTFAFDEPIIEFLEAASEMPQPCSLLVTGRKSKAGKALGFASDRVRFTDFLPNAQFDALLRTADLVIDLTTRDNCLVCGAYEAVAAGAPVLVSDSRASRETFSKGCLYAANNRESYKQALREFFARPAELREEIRTFREEFVRMWEKRFRAICAEIRTMLA